MERAKENGERFNLTLSMNGVQRDLIDKLINGQQGENGEEMELNFRLFLKGKFAVDPTRRNARRSSSISNLVFTVDAVAENGGGAHQESNGSGGSGSSRNGAGNNPSGIRSISLQIEQEPSVRAADPNANGGNETLGNNSMFDMPFVSTRWDGVNGEKVDGFLYKYRNVEEVRIVCICHGRFLSPAEFVRHGGGGDVENPLRHIIVNQFPTF